MIDPTITCPKCHSEIKLTESLAAPLMEAAKSDFSKKLSDLQRESKLALDASHKVALKEAKELVKAEFEAKDQSIQELHSELKEKDGKLATAQAAEAKLMKKERELDDARREMQLTIEKEISESLAQVRTQAKQEAEEAIGLRLADKEQMISGLQAKINELQRKAEQGSQQSQGEVLEMELETLLKQSFPSDLIEPVPKGVHGGDIVHKVVSNRHCGTILWETKRTKNFKDEWLSKLRGDQRDAGAELAVLVSQTLPEGLKTFDLRDGVWVCEIKYALPLALVLRQLVKDLAQAKSVKEGQQTKTEIIYTYITGDRFKHRVQAVAEKLNEMREDLDKERKSMTRHWAKREEQTREIAESMAGMYGDLQGIAGSSLDEIEGFKLIGG